MINSLAKGDYDPGFFLPTEIEGVVTTLEESSNRLLVDTLRTIGECKRTQLIDCILSQSIPVSNNGWLIGNRYREGELKWHFFQSNYGGEYSVGGQRLSDYQSEIYQSKCEHKFTDTIKFIRKKYGRLDYRTLNQFRWNENISRELSFYKDLIAYLYKEQLIIGVEDELDTKDFYDVEDKESYLKYWVLTIMIVAALCGLVVYGIKYFGGI